MTLPPLPPLPPLQHSLPLLPPLPPLPAPMSPWFAMRIPPWEKGEYEVEHVQIHTMRNAEPARYTTREYWDGKRWPGLAGKFSAERWRGLGVKP